MSSVNKKFPKMDLLKLVYLRNLHWVSVCQETGSCTLFYRAFPLPFLSGLSIVTKSSSIRKIFTCFPVGNFVRHTAGSGTTSRDGNRQLEGVNAGLFLFPCSLVTQ